MKAARTRGEHRAFGTQNHNQQIMCLGIYFILHHHFA
ncbi:hypothetical protein GGE46_002760 [Rhizobium etli]|uniref:Uncharacterized protein n=1 Tax=Rhizobium etli TaxID=29449 RepID=A0A7W6ZHM0_RHIET|nr:hypothetical protein [Rhizobium etli]MBB4536273.1 hypothetical protein [Rhizobium etli]